MPSDHSTAVQVAVRVRPLNQQEMAIHSQSVIERASDEQLTIGSTSKQKTFTFDRVYYPDASQEDVYRHSVHPLVNSFIDGYNATIFAYGQTSSGKTHTMGTGASENTPEEFLGIIPRAANSLFSMLVDRQAANQISTWSVLLTTNNSIMLDSNQSANVSDSTHFNTTSIVQSIHGASQSSHLSIRELPSGEIVVMNSTKRKVSSAKELLAVLESGSMGRMTASTNMNATSSRSHAIFSIFLEQDKVDTKIFTETEDVQIDTDTKASTEAESGTDAKQSDHDVIKETDIVPSKLISKFHFVDLAGSERLKKTGATGARMNEGISINQGLLALSQVISALSKIHSASNQDTQESSNVSTHTNPHHIPFRDSKITRLLQDSLGGNCKTLMVACISSASFNEDESLSTLQYASRAKLIQNKPVVNRDPIAQKIHMLETKVQLLKERLKNCQCSSTKQFDDEGSTQNSRRRLTTNRGMFSGKRLQSQDLETEVQSGTSQDPELLSNLNSLKWGMQVALRTDSELHVVLDSIQASQSQFFSSLKAFSQELSDKSCVNPSISSSQLHSNISEFSSLSTRLNEMMDRFEKSISSTLTLRPPAFSTLVSNNQVDNGTTTEEKSAFSTNHVDHFNDNDLAKAISIAIGTHPISQLIPAQSNQIDMEVAHNEQYNHYEKVAHQKMNNFHSAARSPISKNLRLGRQGPVKSIKPSQSIAKALRAASSRFSKMRQLTTQAAMGINDQSDTESSLPPHEVNDMKENDDNLMNRMVSTGNARMKMNKFESKLIPPLNSSQHAAAVARAARNAMNHVTAFSRGFDKSLFEQERHYAARQALDREDQLVFLRTHEHACMTAHSAHEAIKSTVQTAMNQASQTAQAYDDAYKEMYDEIYSNAKSASEISGKLSKAVLSHYANNGQNSNPSNNTSGSNSEQNQLSQASLAVIHKLTSELDRLRGELDKARRTNSGASNIRIQTLQQQHQQQLQNVMQQHQAQLQTFNVAIRDLKLEKMRVGKQKDAFEKSLRTTLDKAQRDCAVLRRHLDKTKRLVDDQKQQILDQKNKEMNLRKSLISARAETKRQRDVRISANRTRAITKAVDQALGNSSKRYMKSTMSFDAYANANASNVHLHGLSTSNTQNHRNDTSHSHFYSFDSSEKPDDKSFASNLDLTNLSTGGANVSTFENHDFSTRPSLDVSRFASSNYPPMLSKKRRLSIPQRVGTPTRQNTITTHSDDSSFQPQNQTYPHHFQPQEDNFSLSSKVKKSRMGPMNTGLVKLPSSADSNPTKFSPPKSDHTTGELNSNTEQLPKVGSPNVRMTSSGVLIGPMRYKPPKMFSPMRSSQTHNASTPTRESNPTKKQPHSDHHDSVAKEN